MDKENRLVFKQADCFTTKEKNARTHKFTYSIPTLRPLLSLIFYGFSVQLTVTFAQPSSKPKLIYLFVYFLFVCFHLYFLLCPICNGWRSAHRDNRERRILGRKVELSSKQFFFFGLVYRHTQTEVVIIMHYLVKAVKGRITNGKQCPIITASPEEHRRVRLAQGHNLNTQYTEICTLKSGERKICLTAIGLSDTYQSTERVT